MKPDIDEILQSFPKDVPVFPLAGVVLFPGAVLPLHVFEPRYRRMLRDVLAGDGNLGIALLKQCSPEEYESKPPFYETICVAHVIHHEPLPDGRANIALLGLSAARAVPTKSNRPYRTAHVDLLDDRLDSTPQHERLLERALERTVPGQGDLSALREQLEEFLSAERIPAALINTCALTSRVLPLQKLELLRERSLARRVERLVELIERPWQWN